MSTVRKHFWHDVSRWLGGFSSPRKYGLNGCIPAVVRSTDGSYEEGTSDADGMRRWPRSSKYDRYFSRISSALTGRQSTKAQTACPVGDGLTLLDRHGAQVPGGVRLVEHRIHVRRANEVRLVPHPRNGRSGRSDLLVDLSPRLRALLVADDCLGLVHLLVERLVVEERPVDVAGLDDVLPVEDRIEHGLRVGEVLEPAHARADLRLVLRNGAELREHRVAGRRAELHAEAQLLEAVQDDRSGGLLVAGVVGDHRDGRALVLPVGEAGLLQVRSGDLGIASRVLEEVDAGPILAPGLIEAGNARREDVVGDLTDSGTAEAEQHGLAVDAGGDGLADVRVVERLLGRVERDPAGTAGVRRRDELILLRAIQVRLQEVRRRRQVDRVGDHRLARQYLAVTDLRVDALVDHDLVEVSRTPVRLRVPVRVAHEGDATTR